MAFGSNQLEMRAEAVANQEVDVRAAFLTRTYGHLAGAVFAWVFLMIAADQLIPQATLESAIGAMVGTQFGWLLVLGAFMVVSFIANRWAQSDTSVGMQYAGLGLYVVAEAVITFPLVYIAAHYAADPNVLPVAAGITLAMFGGLTGVVFFTRKDFSFLKGILAIGSMVALGLIVVSLIFGFSLGTFFCVAMVGLMCGYILYYTSNVLHYYRSDQHVAASLALFASLATLFYYVLMLVMGSRD